MEIFIASENPTGQMEMEEESLRQNNKNYQA